MSLIGATTENPYFEVNSALLSRCRVYELRALDDEQVLALLRRALGDERGIAAAPQVDDDALEFLAARSAGDARTALSALELACETVGEGATVTLRVAEDALQRSAILYDKGGDLHYDLISAWIKSTRGSDPDASLLYLAAMLEGGEDPRFIARRMVILASEDIGNADPRALEVAVNVGAGRGARGHARVRPEPRPGGRLPGAGPEVDPPPTRRSGERANGCASTARRSRPRALRSAAYPGAKKLGRGLGYDYPHDRPEGVSEQELMPDEAIGERFLELTEHGEERELRERLERIRKARGRDARRARSARCAARGSRLAAAPRSRSGTRPPAAAVRRGSARPPPARRRRG